MKHEVRNTKSTRYGVRNQNQHNPYQIRAISDKKKGRIEIQPRVKSNIL